MTNKLVFVPNWGQLDHSLVVLFNTKEKVTYVYDMIDNKPMKKDADRDREKVNHKSLWELSSDPKIVAIFGQYSHHDYLIEKDKWNWDETSGMEHGVVILFNDGNSLKYCYTSAKVFNPLVSESVSYSLKTFTKFNEFYNEFQCKPEKLKVLIKCDPKNTTTTTTSTPSPMKTSSLITTQRTTTSEPEEEEIDWTLVLVIGIIGLIVIIISIIVIILVYIKENPEKSNVLSGVKPPQQSPRFLQDSASSSTIGQPSTVSAAKSEAFTVKSNVDYTKPIPLNSNISTNDSTLQ